MTDPTPTRAEVEAQRRAVSFLRSQHAQICFERGDHKDEVDTPWSRGADTIEQCAALLERAEEAERDRAHADAVILRQVTKERFLANKLTAARRAEAAAWNDAIEAADKAAIDRQGRRAMGDGHGNSCYDIGVSDAAAAIRALRRAAPTEGEA